MCCSSTLFANDHSFYPPFPKSHAYSYKLRACTFIRILPSPLYNCVHFWSSFKEQTTFFFPLELDFDCKMCLIFTTLPTDIIQKVIYFRLSSAVLDRKSKRDEERKKKNWLLHRSTLTLWCFVWPRKQLFAKETRKTRFCRLIKLRNQRNWRSNCRKGPKTRSSSSVQVFPPCFYILTSHLQTWQYC